MNRPHPSSLYPPLPTFMNKKMKKKDGWEEALSFPSRPWYGARDSIPPPSPHPSSSHTEQRSRRSGRLRAADLERRWSSLRRAAHSERAPPPSFFPIHCTAQIQAQPRSTPSSRSRVPQPQAGAAAGLPPLVPLATANRPSTGRRLLHRASTPPPSPPPPVATNTGALPLLHRRLPLVRG